MTVAQSRDSLSPSGFITPSQFEQLCQNNPDISIGTGYATFSIANRNRL
jgi:hypothetical protein